MKDLLAQVKDEDGNEINKYEGKQRIYFYMKMFYGLFISWLGYNLLMNEKAFERNKKYLKESLISIKSLIEYYYPNLLSNEKLIYFFDYNNLLNKTEQIISIFCILFIFGGFLVSIGLKMGKIIVIIDLLLNILLIYNIKYFKEETLKANVLKYWSFLGGAIYL